MKKLQNRLLLTLVTIVLYSCTSITYDIELPKVETKLVVNGTFEEGRPFDIIISQSITRATTQKMKPVSNATVLLFENGQLLDTLSAYEDLTYVGSVLRWHYKSNVKSKIGNEYGIKVNATGFNPVSAKSIVPEKAAIKFVSWEKVKRTEQYGSEYLRANLEISKINPEGYYFLAVSSRSSIYDTYKRYALIKMNDPVLGRYRPFIYVDYILFKGDVIPTEPYGLSIDLGDNFSSNLIESSVVFFELVSLSGEEYHYRETLMAQKNVDVRISEPVKVFSNIEGGLGIFAGISVARDSLVWGNCFSDAMMNLN